MSLVQASADMYFNNMTAKEVDDSFLFSMTTAYLNLQHLLTRMTI